MYFLIKFKATDITHIQECHPEQGMHAVFMDKLQGTRGAHRATIVLKNQHTLTRIVTLKIGVRDMYRNARSGITELLFQQVDNLASRKVTQKCLPSFVHHRSHSQRKSAN